jgi:Ser/Thr protein kinase RdoA (MazF antagonist)
MKFELFKADNLSKKEISYDTECQNFDEVYALLDKFYGIDPKSVLEVKKIHNDGRFSSNWFIRCEDQSYVLKSRFGQAFSIEKIIDEIRMLKFLREKNFPVCEVIQTSEGRDLFESEDKTWILFEKLEGKFFNRSISELKSSASHFAKLSFLLNQENESAKLKSEYSLSELQSFLLEYSDIKSSDLKISALLESNKELLEKTVEELMEHEDGLLSHSIILHLDYHPLNLLFTDGEVSGVMDYNDIVEYSACSGLGFCAYKMIREYLVEKNHEDMPALAKEAVSVWKKAWSDFHPSSSAYIHKIALGAKHRVLRHIHFILNKWLVEKDPKFNYDLEKQIKSLGEIDFIFA